MTDQTSSPNAAPHDPATTHHDPMPTDTAARELAAAIVEWGGCFDCCSDSGAAFDKVRPDAQGRWADERIVEALLDLVQAARAETLAEFVEERASGPSLHTVRRLVGPWEPAP